MFTQLDGDMVTNPCTRYLGIAAMPFGQHHLDAAPCRFSNSFETRYTITHDANVRTNAAAGMAIRTVTNHDTKIMASCTYDSTAAVSV